MPEINKKSFVLYNDCEELINELSDEQAGKLFKAIFHYEKTGELFMLDSLSKVVMISIKQSLDRNRISYQKRLEANQNNGKKGGRPKKPNGLNKKPKEPNGLNGLNNKPKKGDSVNVNVSVSVPVPVNVTLKEIKESFDRFYAAYPKKKSPRQAQATFTKVIKEQKIKTTEELNSFTETLINSINLQITEHKNKNPGADFKYWQNPSTWLNAGGWLNEVDLRIQNQQQEQQQQTPKTAGQRNVEFMDWLRQKKLEQINQQKIRG